MTSANQTHIDTLIDFIASQMDGGQVPPAGSADLNRLAAAIAAIQANPSDHDLQTIGLRVIGAVIDRVRSGIATESALRDLSGGAT